MLLPIRTLCSTASLRSLACKHAFCLSCWSTYFQWKVNGEGSVELITCPQTDCQLVVDDDTVVQTLGSDTATRRLFHKLLAASFVRHNRCLTLCPGLDCDHVAQCSSGLREPHRVVCSHCSESFCFACGWSWHDPVLCDRLAAWSEEVLTDAGTYYWMMVNTKDCPKCRFTIEKNGGCNHMVCRNPACKYEFCWLCLDAWQPHGSRWYQCNRFDNEAAQAARAAQAASRLVFDRYLFYSSRYFNHRQSLSFEAQLTESVSDKIALVHMTNTTGSLAIDSKFVHQAVQLLCNCRRTLMYTYVFAYYLKRNNQLAIFEENQYDLEQAAEQLSALLERDWTPAGLDDLKQPLQDKARYCDSRRQVLVDHVHEGYEKDWWEYVDSASLV